MPIPVLLGFAAAGAGTALYSVLVNPRSTTRRIWGKAIKGEIDLTAEDFAGPGQWGGTTWLEHLEDSAAGLGAHSKYLERLEGWSTPFDTTEGAWPNWSAGDRKSARNAALWIYSSSGGTDPVAYWSRVAEWWNTQAAGELSSLHPDQFSIIVDAVGASQDAASGYRTARGEGFDLPDLRSLKIPWWAYGVAGLVVWNTIRK